MKRWPAALLAVALPAAAFEPFRLTEQCNTLPVNTVSVGISDTFFENLGALAISDFPRHLDALRRLWEPQQMTTHSAGGNSFVYLDYDARQDVAQIAAEIRADGLLRALGITSAQVFTPSCVSSGPFTPSGPSPLTLVEYRNPLIDHYVITTAAEGSYIASGRAGPGWQNTQERLSTVSPSFCIGSAAVYRFYGPSANSHVYTQDPAQCGRLRQSGSGWIYEGVAFGAWRPIDGECPQGKRPVWGVFNGRNDRPNRRYVANPVRLSDDLLRGWVYEGVAFCVNP